MDNAAEKKNLKEKKYMWIRHMQL